MSAEPANSRAIEAWNIALFDKSCRYERLLVQGLEAHGSQLFERVPRAPGARVPDEAPRGQEISGELAFIVWKVRPWFAFAIDAMAVRDGKILLQTFVAYPFQVTR